LLPLLAAAIAGVKEPTSHTQTVGTNNDVKFDSHYHVNGCEWVRMNGLFISEKKFDLKNDIKSFAPFAIP